LTPPRLRFKAGAFEADSGGGSYTDGGKDVAAERTISRKLLGPHLNREPAGKREKIPGRIVDTCPT
jgi:hypothetical protein